MADSEWIESSNDRPGEPLRSWLGATPVVKVDALATVGISRSRDALGALIAGDPLTLEDQVALGRLNSFAVSRWYEPVVDLRGKPAIDPDVAEFFSSC
ncbi:hypothetical protein [Microbacterium gilvum]|uniref:Uncharacterized protein n=1 Tax=Microbacterium gilvum TaxID=1336204 RepID=A0ABP9A264_9MICO